LDTSNQISYQEFLYDYLHRSKVVSIQIQKTQKNSIICVATTEGMPDLIAKKRSQEADSVGHAPAAGGAEGGGPADPVRVRAEDRQGRSPGQRTQLYGDADLFRDDADHSQDDDQEQQGWQPGRQLAKHFRHR